MRTALSIVGTCVIVAITVAAVAWYAKYLIDANRPSNGLEPRYPCLVQVKPDEARWVLCKSVKYGTKLYKSMEESV